jgi:hypothetical protein
VIHQVAAAQRAKAGVDVVKARVSQTNRDQLDIEKGGDLRVRLDLGSKAEACP